MRSRATVVAVSLRLILVLATSCLFTKDAHSEPSGRAYRLGLLVGVVSATLEPTDGPDSAFDPLSKVRAGLFASRQIAQRMSGGLGLVVEGKGGTWTAGRRLDLIYLTLPAKIYVWPVGTTLRPFATAGLEVGYLLRVAEGSEDPPRYEADYTGVFKAGDAGLTVGAGLGFPLAGRSVAVELSYYRGLVDIDAAPGDMEGSRPGVETRALRVSLEITL